MKEARKLAQKEQQELKIATKIKLENKRLSLRLKRNKGFKHSEKRLRIQYYEPRGDLMNYRIN